MLKKILIGIVVIIVLFVIVVAVQPSSLHIERSLTMAAPADKIFEQINDFHNWDAWSPWAKLDPNIKTTFEGPPSGTGAIHSWVGNKDVGEGRMTILKTKPNELISIKLEFIKPFESTAITDFLFASEGEMTTVTWSMDCENNFISKAFGLFMDMDKMIGADYEKGLANLKSIVEVKPE